MSAAATAPLKRFYTHVAVEPAAHGRFRLLLDGRPVQTPMRRELALGSQQLAMAAADEWSGQGERIDLSAMPMTRLAMSVTDHVEPRLDAVREEALKFGATDLLCYRADTPARLVARQHETWRPYLDWAAETLGARLATRAGVMALAQADEAMAALALAIDAFGAGELLVLHALTYRFGSLVLGLAVLHGRASAAEALEASRLDETFQAEIWGRDPEANARNERLAREVEDLARFLSLLG